MSLYQYLFCQLIIIIISAIIIFILNKINFPTKTIRKEIIPPIPIKPEKNIYSQIINELLAQHLECQKQLLLLKANNILLDRTENFSELIKIEERLVFFYSGLNIKLQDKEISKDNFVKLLNTEINHLLNNKNEKDN